MRSLLRSIRRFLSELRRRNVYQVAIAYLAASFVAVELADIAAGTFDLPAWFGPMVWVMVGIVNSSRLPFINRINRKRL